MGRFTYEQLAQVQHFFPESDIPETDLRILSILEVIKNQGLFFHFIHSLLDEEREEYIKRITFRRPSVPALLWLLADASPALLTTADTLRVKPHVSEHELVVASGIIQNTSASIRVVSIEENGSHSPRGLIYTRQRQVPREYRPPSKTSVAYA